MLKRLIKYISSIVKPSNTVVVTDNPQRSNTRYSGNSSDRRKARRKAEREAQELQNRVDQREFCDYPSCDYNTTLIDRRES